MSVDEIQFGFMPERKIDAALILRMMQEEYHAKGKKLYMCFVNPEKALDRLPYFLVYNVHPRIMRIYKI